MPDHADRRDRVRGTRWDLFCRVVDNFGDAAVCWRLARQLAREHGARPRLWIDDPATLTALVPGAAAGAAVDGVTLEAWTAGDPRLCATTADDVADVVVGAFACTLPEAYRAAMRARRPVWIDLEYLSAEGWVPGHHGLPSPKPDGLVEHFFFPGLDAATGGLLREADLIARRDAFDADARTAFLASIGVAPREGERLASLFCYPDAPARALLDALAARAEPWRVLVPHGVAPQAAGHPLAVPIPFVPQADYDRLLWSCDLNLVRGEDSLVRALWAARPMVWQIYRQDEDAHRPKLQALLDGWIAEARPAPAAAAALAAMEAAWNADPRDAHALLPAALDALLDALPELRSAAGRWVARAAARPDLCARLVDFVSGRL
ncbi:MAG: hypothetical protein RJA99_2338 [Pseudomonadota bacterium]|jgi:uncharacterized repeat protein (TIGR03837 family)